MTPEYTYKAKLARVIDGDTIVVDVDLGLGVWMHGQYLRLLGVNTPEIRGEERARGLQARLFVLSELEDGNLVIKTHKGDKKGKYGRWLATVHYVNWDGEWANLNKELLEHGHAEVI
jgi:micrococcal nuclease